VLIVFFSSQLARALRDQAARDALVRRRERVCASALDAGL
jgi:hypothetical protein